MAINKEKNVLIQVTFPKAEAERLETMKKAFNENGVKVSKSDILLRAYHDYERILVMTCLEPKEAKEDKK